MSATPISSASSPLPEPLKSYVAKLEGAALNYGSAVSVLPGGSAAQQALVFWDRRRQELDAHLLGLLHRWRCFHCDEVFTRQQDALEHFGAWDGAEPACKLARSEQLLVGYIRELEGELQRWQRESHPLLLAIATQRSEHTEALQRAEEDGYARGLRDMGQRVAEILRDDKLTEPQRIRLEDVGVIAGERALPRDWVVWSWEHDGWWAPRELGYVKDLEHAGRYTSARALDIQMHANAHRPPDAPNELALSLEQARTFDPSVRTVAR